MVQLIKQVLRFVVIVLALLLIVPIVGDGGLRAQGPQQTPRSFTILAVNDIYRLDGVGREEMGGLRTLRKWLEGDTRNLIVLHAGDFLSPSLISREFQGEQMIDVMNNLDGDGLAFDDRMFVTFGNHEFDDSTCGEDDVPLPRRVAESQFTWLAGNLDFSACNNMKTIPNHGHVQESVVVDVGSVKVGIFGIGLTPDPEDTKGKYPRYLDELSTARRLVRKLQGEGANVVIALTHLLRHQDETLIENLGRSGLDLIVGGHDHSQMVIADRSKTPRGFKADSDARTAWRIDVEVPAIGRPAIKARLITLNEAIPPDPDLEKLAARWLAKAGLQICAKRSAELKTPNDPNCLSETIGRTQTLIELEEIANRSRETGFGDWLADLVARDANARVAIVNSGGLGLNTDLQPGSALLLRDMIDLFRFDDVVAVRRFNASMVCDAIRHGLTQKGNGAWPHLSGVRAKIPPSVSQAKTPEEAKAHAKEIDIAFVGEPAITCDSSETVAVAAVPFILCGGDGYPLKISDPLTPGETCSDALHRRPNASAAPMTLGAMTETEIRKAGDSGISPTKDGRIGRP